MTVRRSLLLGLAGLALVAGCGTPEQPQPATPTDQGAEAQIPAAVAPRSVQVPAIGASSGLVATGLNPDGTVEVPPVTQPEQASWFGRGVRPGEPGPAVILGHINGDGRPGVFARLAELEPGDEVRIGMPKGRTLVFTVDRVDSIDKDQFPTREVYGDTDRPEIRLVSCGGTWVGGEQGYAENVIAYGHLTGES